MTMLRTQYTIEVVADEVSGGTGYMLADGFDGGEYGVPYAIHEPRLLAHDILEHVSGPANIGPADDELLAIGAVAHVRPELDNLHYDVANILADDYDGDIYEGTPVYVLDGTVRRMLRRAAVRGTAMYRDENADDVDEYPVLDTARRVYSYLCEGYAQATAHYAGVKVCDMFNRITEQARVWSTHWLDESYIGCTFDVTLDWNATECYISTEPNEWEYDDDE